VGTEQMVRTRMLAAKVAGINTLRIAPVGRTSTEMIQHLERLVPLIQSI
jgi:hypothetical protein